MKIHVKLTIFIALIISSFQLEEGVESPYGDIIVLNSDSNSNLNSNLNSVLICWRTDLLLDRGGGRITLGGGLQNHSYEGVESLWGRAELLYGDIIVLNSVSNSNLNSNLNSVLISWRTDLLLDRGGAESLL